MGIKATTRIKNQESHCLNLLQFVLFILSCFLFMETSYAQQKPETHKVKRGETLYSIAKQYNVSLDELTSANPDVSKGLKTGKEIIIPVKQISKSGSAQDSIYRKFIFHKVETGETLYSISKKYNIGLQTLLQVNPDIIDGLQIGQLLKVPLLPGNEITGKLFEEQEKNPSGISEIEKHAPSDKIKSTGFTEVSENKISSDSVLPVLLFLPLYLQDNFSQEDSSDLSTYDIYPPSKAGLDFYEGALIAADSLRNSGYHIALSVYDTRNDTAHLKSILSKPELKKSNLIIGPLQNSDINPILRFSTENNIPLAVPFIVSRNVLDSSHFLSSGTASVKTQCEEMAAFLNKNLKSDSVLFISSGLQKETELISYFKGIIVQRTHELVYPKQGIAGIKEHLSKKKNLLIICSSDESIVNNLLSQLNNLKDSTITVVGMPTWENFQSIEYAILQNLHVHYFTTKLIDYSSHQAIIFRKKFRERFSAEPSDAAFQGFDITYFYLNMALIYGRKFIDYLPERNYEALHTRYLFRKINENSGFENTHIKIVHYENFSLKVCSR